MADISKDARKYGYSNSRVKAMSARLIAKSTMQNILNANDISTILSILFQTDYKKEISEYGGQEIKTELIDFALSKNLAEHISRLYVIAPTEDRNIIKAIIARWDLYNVKLALEAKDSGLGYDAIAEYVIDYGPYNATVIKDILRESAVENMFNRFMVNSPYRSIIARAAETYSRSRSISEAIAAIDKGYYSELSATIKKLNTIDRNSAVVIRMEIDLVNIITIIRAKRMGLKFQDIERDIVDNGRLNRLELSRIYSSSPTVEGVVQQIKSFDLNDALHVFNKNHQLLSFEISMKNRIFESSMRLLKHAVLSFGTILAYMYLKEIEVYALRISINSKYYGLTKEEVSRLITWKS